MPIGNLTSQVFANIYLNELDRYIVHTLHADAYLRYGDDFIVIGRSREELKAMRISARDFLTDRLRLVINPRHDTITPIGKGLKFLGVEIFPNGRRLLRRSRARTYNRLNPKNVSSYWSKHRNKK